MRGEDIDPATSASAWGARLIFCAAPSRGHRAVTAGPAPLAMGNNEPKEINVKNPRPFPTEGFVPDLHPPSRGQTSALSYGIFPLKVK